MNAKTLYFCLEKNDKEIVWLIGGEKMLFAPWGRDRFGRLNYSWFYRQVDGKVVGDIWFEEERSKDLE